METIFDILKSWPGAVEIDGRILDDSTGALTGALNAKRIILYANNKNATESKSERPESVSSNAYLITVKSYMTKKSSPGFDFMAKWNNDVPMPLITMVGTIERETPGMVYMKLRGELVSTVTATCMRCGKPITNAVSQYFGLGPICGGHNYINPFNSERELKEAVENYRTEYLNKITWEGWVIRSAIIAKQPYPCV